MPVVHADFRSKTIVSRPLAYRIDWRSGLSSDADDSEADPDCSDSVSLAERKASKSYDRKAPVVLSGMQWKPRKQRFEARSVSFDPETQEAYSYGWWRFVERIGPYLVFNSYRYSVSTSKHQGLLYWGYGNERYGLLADLGLSVDLRIEAPRGLQDLDSAVSLYERRIADLECRIKIATVKMLQALREKDDRKAEALNG
jgi:hypothetical protein